MKPVDLLHRIYERGGRLELESSAKGNKLKPYRADGSFAWTDEERKLIREHRRELAHLLREESVHEEDPWSFSIREALKDTPRDLRYSQEFHDLLEAAQDAYENDDAGLCRYQLRRFVETARREREAFEEEMANPQRELVHVEAEKRGYADHG